MADQVETVLAVLRALADQRGSGTLEVYRDRTPGEYRYTIGAGTIGQTAMLYRTGIPEEELRAVLSRLLQQLPLGAG